MWSKKPPQVDLTAYMLEMTQLLEKLNNPEITLDEQDEIMERVTQIREEVNAKYGTGEQEHELH